MEPQAFKPMGAAARQAGTVQESASRPAPADGWQLTCYEGRVPDYAQAELERLYASLFSSVQHLEVEGALSAASCVVARRDGAIRDLWLYRVQGRCIQVLNEGIAVETEALERFAHTMFARYPQTGLIRLHAVYPQLQACGLPLRTYPGSDDTVLALPESEEAYLAALGKQTRKNMRRYVARWHESHPGFRLDVVEGTAIAAQDLQTILEFNRRRMQAKGKHCGIDARQAQHMLALGRRCGFLIRGRMDGRICMGALVYRIGDHCFSWLRAHDPAYDDERLGLVGAYLLVRSCIEHRARALHFMWGREPHKQLLGGEVRESRSVLVFRSRAEILLQGPVLLQHELAAARQHLRSQLVERAAGDGLSGRALRSLRDLVRRLRR